MLVYQLIQQSGTTGLWTKDMKFQSNLQQPQITKILKILESRKLVKSVKSVSGGNRKVYMLYELEPSRELTGGAWYTEHEFDSEFIEALREACLRFIQKQGDATLEEIAAFIKGRGFSKVDLREEDILSIVNTLLYDGRVTSVEDEEDIDHFRPAILTIPKFSAFTSIPCGVCPVRRSLIALFSISWPTPHCYETQSRTDIGTGSLGLDHIFFAASAITTIRG
jgi:DNA-directed RNA polymerase III subunit RPC6